MVCLKGTKEKPEIKPFFSTIRFRFHLVEIWGFCALAQTVALRARANRLFSSSPIPRRRGKAKAFPFFVVEIWGFEPQTYTLRTYRATNCAISPFDPNFGSVVMVGTTGLEPVTSCMSSKRSNQLSYAPSSAYVLYQLFFIMASIFTLFILKAPKNSAPFLIINIRRRSRSIRRNRRRSRNRPRRNPPNTRRNRSRRHSPRSRSRNPRRSCPPERMQAFPPC